MKDLIDLNKQATFKIKDVEAQKAELEADVVRQTNLVKDITEAQRLTCKKFEDF